MLSIWSRPKICRLVELNFDLLLINGFCASNLISRFCCTVSDVYCMYNVASVYCEKGQCTHKFNILDVEKATAYGIYNDTLEQTGWGILNISAGYGSKKVDDVDILFAAGYLEAILTQKYVSF